MSIYTNIKNNRFVYLGYFIKKTNWAKLKSDLNFVNQIARKGKLFLLFDMILSSLRYRSSFHEYFYYAFFNKKGKEKKTYATSGQMYEYQLRMNPLRSRCLLEDKLVFLKKYKALIGRSWLEINSSSLEQISEFMKGREKLVLKNAKGQAGQTINIIKVDAYSPKSLLTFSKKNDFDLLEEYVYQHKSIMEIAPASLNTIRIISQIDNEGKAIIIGTILRLGSGRETDNLSTDGLACPIDPENGLINGPGISFDITKPDFYFHPVTKKELIGFQIPFWKESIELVKKAALLHPENRSVGWDVAIKDTGPILIEGNHNWGVRLWQMPEKRGLKCVLKKFN